MSRWIVVVSLLVALFAGGLGLVQRSQLREVRAENAELSAELEDLRSGQGELVDAVARAVAGEVSDVRGQVEDLEETLFGFGGAPSVESDVIGDLEGDVDGLSSCVNRLMDALAVSSGFYRYC